MRKGLFSLSSLLLSSSFSYDCTLPSLSSLRTLSKRSMADGTDWFLLNREHSHLLAPPSGRHEADCASPPAHDKLTKEPLWSYISNAKQTFVRLPFALEEEGQFQAVKENRQLPQDCYKASQTAVALHYHLDPAYWELGNREWNFSDLGSHYIRLEKDEGKKWYATKLGDVHLDPEPLKGVGSM